MQTDRRFFLSSAAAFALSASIAKPNPILLRGFIRVLFRPTRVARRFKAGARSASGARLIMRQQRHRSSLGLSRPRPNSKQSPKSQSKRSYVSVLPKDIRTQGIKQISKRLLKKFQAGDHDGILVTSRSRKHTTHSSSSNSGFGAINLVNFECISEADEYQTVTITMELRYTSGTLKKLSDDDSIWHDTFRKTLSQTISIAPRDTVIFELEVSNLLASGEMTADLKVVNVSPYGSRPAASVSAKKRFLVAAPWEVVLDG